MKPFSISPFKYLKKLMIYYYDSGKIKNCIECKTETTKKLKDFYLCNNCYKDTKKLITSYCKILIHEDKELKNMNEEITKQKIKELIATNIKTNGNTYHLRKNEIRISHIITPCTRKIILDRDLDREDKIYNFPILNQDYILQNIPITALGTKIHELIQQSIKDKAQTLKIEEKVNLETDTKFDLVGHLDLLLLIENNLLVCDIKTTNDLDFQIEREYVPKKEHIQQNSLYMKALNIKNGAIIYVDRSTGRMKVYLHEQEYIDEIMLKLIKIQEYEKNKTLPDPRKIWLCNYCLHKCFS